MRRCPACHALYPDLDRFCETDGESLVVERDKKLSLIPTLPVAQPPDDVLIVSGPSLLGEASHISAERVPELIEQVVLLARRFERDNLAWQPQPEDFVLVEGDAIAIASARGVFRRVETDKAFDVRPALRALGEALLDAPVGLCSTAIVRLLSDPSLPALPCDDALAMMRSAEELAPDVAGHAATLAHMGYKRTKQQDAAHVATGDGWTVLALCDGVSGSIDGGMAARVG
jgi:hypothetical protein